MNLLRGRAAQWGTALWEAGSDALESYDTFVTEMRKVFDHPVLGSEAATRLFFVTPVCSANYSLDFRVLAAKTGWNEPAFVSFFKRELSDRLLDELASKDEPDSLEELISLVIRLDNRLREREGQRSFSSHRSASSTSSQLPLPLPTPQSSPRESLSRPTWTLRTLPAPEEPMQVGRTRLTPEERQRQFTQQLCLYCSQTGHLISICPVLPKGPALQ